MILNVVIGWIGPIASKSSPRVTSFYTVSQKNVTTFSTITLTTKCPIRIIFDTVSSQSMRHRKMVSFPTSPI